MPSGLKKKKVSETFTHGYTRVKYWFHSTSESSQGTVAWVEDLKISSRWLVLRLPGSQVNLISWVVGNKVHMGSGFRIFLVAENVKTLIAWA